MEKYQVHPDLFEIRSETSYSNAGLSRCPSVDSEEASAQQLSYIIDEIIVEEKKKYAPSRSDNVFKQSVSFVGLRKAHCISNINFSRIGMQIPKNISRIIGSSKIYPNVPDLNSSDQSADAIYGAFFGFLIGDIAGSHLAYTMKGLEELVPNALLMNGGGTYNLGAGQGTDQTQIMLSLCYGLLQGKGTYNKNLIAKQYLDWYESKPFNFSAVFALSIRELHIMKMGGKEIDEEKLNEMLVQSSEKNINQQSSIGLIRILPLVLFGLQFDEDSFNQLIQGELKMICPNSLVVESGLLYARILKTIILTRDHGLAFYEASKKVYQSGSQKLIELWKVIEQGVQIPSRGNMGKLKTSFTYACIQLHKPQQDFMDSLIKILLKGGDTETNCAVVMAIVGAIVGYNGIPNYFKQKIVNSRVKNSPRPREEKYSPHNIIQIIEKMRQMQSSRFSKGI